jgi:hypothetical protein
MAIDTKTSSPAVSEWIGDVVALERHIDSVLDRYASGAVVPPIIRYLHEMVHESSTRAKNFHPGHDHPAKSSVIQEGLALLDRSALLIERIDEGTLSHVLRNCFVACNLAAVTYSMLHTSAIALEDEDLAGFTARGLRTYAELISEIGTVMPGVVVGDLSDTRIDPNAAAIASSQQQEMWEAATGWAGRM